MRRAGHRRGAMRSVLSAALLTLFAASGAASAATPAKLAYVTGLAGTHPQVHVANADGSGAVGIGAGVDALISPDGTRLAVVVNTKRLVAIDVATGAQHTIARGQIQGASFSPDGSQVAYARSRSARLLAPVNVFVAQADGSSAHAITHDGRSLYPLWGSSRIAYTHERLRRADAPVYQLRVMRPNGSSVRQLTHLRIPRLLSGLTATAWSADGSRLLAEYGGQDTSEAWTVDVASGRARDLTGRFDGVIGANLSADGSTVLVQRGYFDDPRHQSVATIPFNGGRATVLVRHGSEPSWGG